MVGGLLLAVPALRLRGPYFGLVTLVAVLLLQNVIVIFAGVTGGEIGMNVPRRAVDRTRRRTTGIALRLHGGLRRAPVRPVALGGRADPAGERPGRDRGGGARLQRHQAQAGGVLRQRAVLRRRRRDADLLRGHRLGRHRRRHRDRACRSSSPPCSAAGAPSWARRSARSAWCWPASCCARSASSTPSSSRRSRWR